MKYTGKKDVKFKSKYPSEYGSHKSMLDDKYSEINEDEIPAVICKDDRGSYHTQAHKLDNGICDYSRAVNIESREQQLDGFLKMFEFFKEKRKQFNEKETTE